jgi:hypothetical protein
VDGDRSAIPLLPTLCYLYERAVTELRELTIPRIRVTKSAIDGLRALSKDTVYWDVGLPGFGVKVTPMGRKVFLVMYRLAGLVRDCGSTPSGPRREGDAKKFFS